MEITFLGTGTSTGVPLIGSNHPVCKSDNPKDKRLRSSILVSFNDFSFVIDTGPDFRQQMLTYNQSKINAIIYTHEHFDHTSGIDDLRGFCFKQGKIPIYAHKRVLENLKNRYSYIFNDLDRYKGAANLKPIEIHENKNFIISKMEITPIKYMHGKLQVFGYRFKDFAYLTDLKTIDKNEICKLKDLEVLVLNCIRIEPHYSHLNLQEAIDLINKIKPKKTYLTHISHLLGFHDQVQKSLPKNIYLSYDGLKINLS